MKNFFKPLGDFQVTELNPKKIAFFWASLIIFITVKITWGNASFFYYNLEGFFAETYFLSWYKWIYHHISTLLVYGIFPFFFIKLFLNEKPGSFGIGLGDWKFGLKATLIALLILPVPLYFSSQNPEHLKVYPLVHLNLNIPSEIALWALVYLAHYIGWEFFYRGYIGFGMKSNYGAFMAIMLQTLLTTLEHIGKPSGEIIGAIPAGIYLGLLTYRTNSIWWAVIFHWYLGVMNSIICSM